MLVDMCRLLNSFIDDRFWPFYKNVRDKSRQF